MRAQVLHSLSMAGLAVSVASGAAPGQAEEKKKGYPDAVSVVHYASPADASEQPALFWAPDVAEAPVPLLVALHTWSADYRQTMNIPAATWCMEHGWAFIHPNFRGPNKRPEATGSDLVVADILGAVEYAKGVVSVDPARIYVVGASGGGYTALLMAAHAPDVWAGVSAWVPISDLRAWYEECTKAGRGYAANVAASCGGGPGASAAVDEQYEKRSPLTHLAKAKGVSLDINAGIHDGHKGSVPVSHSLEAFNAVAAPEDRLSEDDISYFVTKRSVPPALRTEVVDPTYGKWTPLFRRQSGRVRVTIFKGGHEIVYGAALRWLAEQRKE